MGKLWRFGHPGGRILIAAWPGDSPDPSAEPIPPERAAEDIDAWLHESSADGVLDDICTELDGSWYTTADPAALLKRVRAALLDGGLRAFRKPVRELPGGLGVVERAPERAPEVRREVTLVDLWVRLDIDPNDASSYGDQFVVSSTDGAYRQSKTVKDDQIPGDEAIDLEFTDLYPDKSYSLEVIPAHGSPYHVFRGVPYAALGGQSGAPEEPYQPREDDPRPEEVNA